LNLNAVAKTQVAGILRSFFEQTKKDADKMLSTKITGICTKDLKIQALILERSLLYGVKNEALSQIQQDLFEEAFGEDLASFWKQNLKR